MNKKLAAMLGVALGLGLVAGCGSSDRPDGAESARSPADSSPTAAPLELTAVDVDQWFADYAAADAAITTVHAVVDQKTTGGVAETTHMEVDRDVASATFAVTMELMGAPAEVVVAEGTAYVRVGGGEPQGLSRNALGLTEATLNPVSAVEREREAVTKVERVGSASEQVGDIDADHYLITYDVARLNELQGADPTAGMVQGETATADIWLDVEGRPARYTSTRTTKTESLTFTVTTDVVYSDCGKAVTIEVPQR